MEELAAKVPEEEYRQLTTEGYFTIRRSDRFWSGIWSDLTIEQVLMRSMKTSGGLTRGQGQHTSPMASSSALMYTNLQCLGKICWIISVYI